MRQPWSRLCLSLVFQAERTDDRVRETLVNADAGGGRDLIEEAELELRTRRGCWITAAPDLLTKR